MKVKVQSKNGKIWDVKPENIGEVYRRGGRLINENQRIKVQSKDGRNWKVKAINIPKVLNRGGNILDNQEDTVLERAKELVKSFGGGVLSGVSSAGLAEAADSFGAGVMEVAPGVVAPILPASAIAGAEAAEKGLEAIESLRPYEDDKLGNVLHKTGSFIGATASMPFPSTTAVNYGKSLLSGAAAGGIAGGLNQYLDVPEPIADVSGIALGNTRPIPVIKLGIQKASDIKIPFASKYNKKVDTNKAERKVSSLVKDLTKEEGLERLNDFKADGLDVVPVTAEVALNNEISGLHNTYAPNSSMILEKQAKNDAILRNKLNDIGIENYTPTVEEVGKGGRTFIDEKFSTLKDIRKKASDPLYAIQNESQNYYPVTNFETAINQGIADNVGDLETLMKRYSVMLPDKNAALLKGYKKKLAGLKKNSKTRINNTEIDIDKLSPKYKSQITSSDPNLQQISDLEAKIAAIEEGNKYRPVHIDSALKTIRNKALDLPFGSPERTMLDRYAAALDTDLVATDVGANARRTFKAYSPEINAIEQDEFLNSFINRDSFGNFTTPAENLPNSLLAAPFESVRKYGKLTKGTDAEKLTKSFLRDKYLGKAIDKEGGLPSYAQSSGFVSRQRPRLEAIFDQKEMSEVDKINEYLKNRHTVTSGNSAFGSATNAKRMIDAISEKYLGPQAIKKYPIASKIPIIKRFADKTIPNPNYTTLHEFLTDPVYAKKVLKKRKGVGFKDLKPEHKGHLAQLLGVVNNQD